jgi:hypothetical protein
MSRANFSWVLAQWGSSDESLAKAVDAVIDAGVVQSGVGYSALLVAFYAPARALLGFYSKRAVPVLELSSRAQRDQWLKEHGLDATWQDDARQILAIVAPIISAPLFDAITKL